jgi:signal transduction histidine kinase
LVIVLLVRRAMRPLQTLSSAAEQLGRGETVPPLEERGPSDIRTTIAAFNQMQWRLQRFVTDRTQMLAAISHDLRSPITALRLRAAMVDHDDTRERMIASLNDMQAMMEATLTFTREDSANEATELADLTSLITDAVTARQEQGHSVQWSPPAPLPYPCRPLALKRSIGNLIDNAVRYGGEATVQLDGTDIIVRDKGPGIPEAQLAYVFEAFTRLEASRNAATGGTGLGLAIARSIMRSHGGDVILRNLPTGGLEARMNLPSAD